MKYFFFDLFYASSTCFIAECMSLTFNYIIRDLIKYVKYDRDDSLEGTLKGVKLLVAFISLIFCT